jgi:hypothetical protein
MQDGIYTRPDSPFWWCCYQQGGKTARKSTRVKVDTDPEGLRAAAVRETLAAVVIPEIKAQDFESRVPELWEESLL